MLRRVSGGAGWGGSMRAVGLSAGSVAFGLQQVVVHSPNLLMPMSRLTSCS